MIARLQYISQEVPNAEHSEAIAAACKAGCQWVQLRMKNVSDDTLLAQAKKSMDICHRHTAQLIINDNVKIAKMVGAGVHLGKTDMPPIEARGILGKAAIIGGTANTFGDVRYLAEQQVDYIGLGPFRYTSTKKDLSPILGIEGYTRILKQCASAGITVPIIAIGGIKMKDLISLFTTGIHGIAVSSMLTNNTYQKETVATFNRMVQQLVLKENTDL